MVGDGTTRESLNQLSSKTGAVSWLPYCAESEALAALYREADLFVHPGILETFGLVTLESQACGTPVVGIHGSYMDRIVFSNQQQWAAENTPESLAAAIENSFKEDLAAIGSQASEKVRSRHDWDGVFGRLLAIYQSCIAGAGSVS